MKMLFQGRLVFKNFFSLFFFDVPVFYIHSPWMFYTSIVNISQWFWYPIINKWEYIGSLSYWNPLDLRFTVFPVTDFFLHLVHLAFILKSCCHLMQIVLKHCCNWNISNIIHATSSELQVLCWDCSLQKLALLDIFCF